MAGYGDGLPILLGYQARWNAETAEVAVCEKSRRIGLSWGDAAERVVHAAEGKGHVFYMSYNKDMTETYIEDCADWARKLGKAVGEITEETFVVDDRELRRYRIHCESGKDVIALASSPRVIRSKGRPGDIVVIDEAAFCDDLEELLKEGLAVTQWGGKVRILSTHNGDENPFAALVGDIRAGRQHYALHRVTLDEAIADGLARRICTVKGGVWTADYADRWREAQYAKYRVSEDADEELGVIPLHGAGAFFSRVLVESRMYDAPVLRYTGTAEFNAWPEPTRRLEVASWLEEHVLPHLEALDPHRRHVIGGDFARSGDLSVYAPLEVGEALKRTCPFLLEMRNVPHLQQVQAVTYVCDRLPRLSGGAFDATGNGSFLAEAMVDAYGSIMEPVMMTESWYRENMPRYRAAFQDDKIAIPASDDVVEDHRAIKVVRGVARLPQGQTAKGRHGDSAIGLGLAWYASEQDTGPIEGAALPPRESFGFEVAPGAEANGERIDHDLGLVRMESAGMTGL